MTKNKLSKAYMMPTTEMDEVYEFLGNIRYAQRYKFCNRAFLYGSRSKLPNEKLKDSDWDIAVPSSGLFAEELSLDGWVEKDLDKVEYRDLYTTHVFEKTFPLGAKVQIALKDDYESFRIIWNNIPRNIFEVCLHKSSENYIGRDGVTSYINGLRLIYDSGVERGKYPSSKDKFMEEVQRARHAEPVEAPAPWEAPQPVRNLGGQPDRWVVQAFGGGGGGAGGLARFQAGQADVVAFDEAPRNDEF